MIIDGALMVNFSRSIGRMVIARRLSVRCMIVLCLRRVFAQFAADFVETPGEWTDWLCVEDKTERLESSERLNGPCMSWARVAVQT